MKKGQSPAKKAKASVPSAPQFATLGRHTEDIDVRIIQLFSEGLYKSPTKAVEELVANSFDAGAAHVHVLTSPDLSASDSSIVVIDDGESMDKKTLAEHWLIGESRKRDVGFRSPKKRKQIGRFGIGKHPAGHARARQESRCTSNASSSASDATTGAAHRRPDGRRSRPFV